MSFVCYTKNTLVRLMSLVCYNKEYTSETHEFSYSKEYTSLSLGCYNKEYTSETREFSLL